MVTSLAFAPSFSVVLVVALLAHLGNGLFANTCIIAMQARIPEPIRGRVLGTISVAFNLGTFGGLWTGGVIALVGDVRWGLAFGPLLMLALILVVLVSQRRIRSLAEVV